jgi:hypothetical protein
MISSWGTAMTELDQRIKDICERRGLRFKPWEFPPPWAIGDAEPCPYTASSAAAAWWSKTQAVRRKLIEEAATK